VFTVQVFRASGESKAAARFNVAQTAMNILRPKIEAELERRKMEKQQKMEARKAERMELLKLRAEVSGNEEKSEMGSCSNDNVDMGSPDTQKDGNASGDLEQKNKSGDAEQKLEQENKSGDTEQKPEAISVADEGTGDGEKTKPRVKVISALRVLKDIRPGIACTEKANLNAPAGYYVARVAVDGYEFEGQGDSLSRAKAAAAASCLTTHFNLSLQTSASKNFYIVNTLL